MILVLWYERYWGFAFFDRILAFLKVSARNCSGSISDLQGWIRAPLLGAKGPVFKQACLLTSHCNMLRQHIILYIYISLSIIIEGSLEVKLPTIWTDEEQRWEESEKRREEKNKEDQKEKVSEDRRWRRAKRWASNETLGFSNDLWLRRVEK